ncbi:MAG: hypothetical protein R2788_18065 [Saprospiraceae bacterium]
MWEAKDLTNPAMKEFSRRMRRIMDEYQNVVYVSAHELDLRLANRISISTAAR